MRYSLARSLHARAGRTTVISLLVLLLAAPAGSATFHAPQVEVRIEPASPTTLPKGVPFIWRASVRSLGEPEFVRLTFELRPAAGGGEAVRVGAWEGTATPETQEVTSGEVVPSRWFAEPGEYLLAAREADATLALTVTPAEHPIPRFRDVTAEVGIEPVVDGITQVCDNFTAGAAWGDVTGSGLPDLYIPYQAERARLYINEGGRFVEQALEFGVANEGRVGMGAVFVDYNNNGLLDLYVVNMGPNRLYENDGEGGFRDIAHEAGVADPGPGSAAAWGDFDGDGYLDLYVANYGECSDPLYGVAEPAPDRLYRANGDGTFTDVSDWLDRETRTRFAFQAGWVDYDGDGRLDLYVANDDRTATGAANVLWRNAGETPGGGWRFVDVSRESGAGVDVFSMGLAIGDYNRSGHFDLAVSNIGPTCLLENQGDGTFVERGAEARVARPAHRPDSAAITWGLVFADVTNNGWEDLYVAAGTGLDETEETDDDQPPPADAPAPMTGPYQPGDCRLPELRPERGPGMIEMLFPLPGDPLEGGGQPNALFVNTGEGVFVDVSGASGADDWAKSRGVAVADFDRDGQLDLLVVNQAGEARLYRNETPDPGHWVAVELTGTRSPRDACGARVEAHLPDGARLLRQVDCGSTGLGTGHDRAVHFGLGEHDRVERLAIRWTSGTRQEIESVAADRRIEVTEPGEPRPAAVLATGGGLLGGAQGLAAAGVLVALLALAGGAGLRRRRRARPETAEGPA